VRFAAIYGNGGAMGFTPQQVDQMSMWQFMAALEGWVKSNSTDEDEGKGTMGAQQADEIWNWLQSKNDVPLTGIH
jgi:hypothetical protein